MVYFLTVLMLVVLLSTELVIGVVDSYDGLRWYHRLGEVFVFGFTGGFIRAINDVNLVLMAVTHLVPALGAYVAGRLLGESLVTDVT